LGILYPSKSAKVVLVGGTRQQRNLLIIPNPPQTDKSENQTNPCRAYSIRR
jgi:hypothetical protein